MAETALIGVDIDLTLINRRLAEAGELTAKEARHMQRELSQSFQRAARASEDAARLMARAQSKAARDAEREAKRAAREIERSFNEQASSVRGLFSAALGGVGGDLLDLVDATDGVSDAMAGLGVAFGTLAIAPVVLGEIAEALTDIAKAGIDARDSLEEAGIMVDQLFTPAQLAALDAYEENLYQNEQAANALATALGAQAAPAAGRLDDAMLGLRAAGGVLFETFSGLAAGAVFLAEKFVTLNPALAPLAMLIEAAGTQAGTTKAEMDALAQAELALSVETANANRAIKEQAEFIDNESAALELLGMNFPPVEQATKKAAEETKKHGAASKKAAEDVSLYQKAVANGTIAVADNTAAIEEQRAAAKRLAEQQQLITETAQGLREEMRLAAEEQANEETSLFGPMVTQIGETVEAMAMLGGSFGGILGNLEQLRAAQQRQHEDRVHQLRDERAQSRDTYRNALAEYEASRENMTAAEQAAAEAELALLATNEKAHRKVLRELEKEERDAAMKAYRRQKALQLVQIAIDGARNAVALTAAFAYAGPWAPVIATGIAGTQAGIAAALVEAQPPPQFHFGTTAVSASLSGNGGAVGIPGAEVPAVLEQGEGVVSRRGMATPGMAELVEALNAGRAPTGRSMVSDIEADLLAQRLNRPYAPAIRGRALAGTNTFYRGR